MEASITLNRSIEHNLRPTLMRADGSHWSAMINGPVTSGVECTVLIYLLVEDSLSVGERFQVMEGNKSIGHGVVVSK